MKAQSKRFLDHRGKSYKMGFKSKKERQSNDSVGFFELWRYATHAELAVTALGVLLSWCCSAGLVSAVVIYGELTSLFVQRHTASPTTSHAHILALFGGGQVLERGNRTLHMDALVDDSIAYAVASVAVMFVQWSTAAIAVNLANWAADRLVNRLRWQLLRSVISQEIAFFDTNTSMNFAATVTEDMEKFRGGVGEHVVMTSYLGGTVVAGGALSLAYGWELTLVGFAIVPVSILVAAVVAKYQTRCSAEEVSAYGAAGRIAEEVFTNIRTVRAYAGEQVEVERYSEALEPAAAAARRRGVWSGAGAGLGWLCTYSLNAVVFGYGARLIVRDMDLPPDQQIYHPGVLVTILFCTFMAAQNIAMCHPHLEIFSSARGAARSLYGLLERRSQIDALEDRGVRPEKFRGDIRFENLYFNYPSRPDVKVLRGLTLSVRAGETVALVGKSGCGKSTLLQLLQRMYEPHSGSLSVDQVPLNDLHLHHFRSSIGVVGQEPVLFSGTIRDNITLGLDNVSEADLIAAAKTAHAHQFITKLANGYETTLGERGASLSGGQKQRIAIARAVLRRPAILLLDEPTSALDPASERQVQAALDAASKGRTTLVVSHRLSTIVNASRIVYMEHGAVLEQGTHQELLEKKGLYWKLVQEDMTNKSIATTVTTEEKEEEEEEEEILQNENHFIRAARPSRRESLTPERHSHLRGSLRVASISSAHIANTAVPDLINHMETLEDEEEMCSDVSTWELLKLNKPERGLLMAGGMASFLVGATMPVFAFLFSKIYGMFAWPDGAAILSTSQLYAGLFAGVAGACGAVTFLQAWLLSVAGARLTDRLRPALLTNYMRQEQGWFDAPQHSVGALCARLAADASAVQGATGTRLGTMLQGISTMVIGIGLAMAYSWKMTLVSLVSVPCVMGGIYLESFITRRSEMKQKRALESASRIATEAVLNVRTVQSLGVESTILARYRSALDESGHKSAWIRGAVYGICLCAPTLGYAVSLAYGGYLIAREDLPYEYAILVSEALIYGAWMLAEALSFAPSFAAAKRSGARVVAALNRQPTILTEKTAKLDPNWNATGDIALSDVHFNYPTRNDVTVLRGASLKVPAGNTVALVGASGSGKSTILQLLTRAYDASSGVLNVAGRNIRNDLPLEQLRQQFGIVAQEPALFSRTIRDNIAYGDNSRRVSLDEIMRVAQQAHVHSFIASLPLGYDTVLSSGGTSLSGGQKQRVAIARALLRNPRVLLLDEATSALDANSEKSVQEALEAASKDRTTIIVAHRLATIQHADLIHVLDKGVVAESGTHDELVKRRGLYWELLQQQAHTAPA